MRKEDDSNYISVWTWLGMLILTMIPILGWVMIVLWTFVGTNESRKNYFRAILLWLFLLYAVVTILGSIFGLWPAIHKDIQGIQHWAQDQHGQQKH